MRFFKSLYGVVSRWHDPLVREQIGAARLLLPFSHKLPQILNYHPHYGSNLTRIAGRVHQKYPDMKLIDVGANIGDTAALLRYEHDFPILCVEADAYYYSILKQNQILFENVDAIQVCLGDRDEDTASNIIRSGGTGRLSVGGGEGFIRTETLASAIKRCPKYADAKMLKVDTDGYDAKILRGARELIQTSHPTMFFEYVPDLLTEQGDDSLQIFEYCRSLGYRGALIYDNTGDLILTADLEQQTIFRNLRCYFSGVGADRYCDICLFHTKDQDIYLETVDSEAEHFERSKGIL